MDLLKTIVLFIFGVYALLFSVPAQAAEISNAPETGYWPANSWRTSTPEQQGVDSESLLKMFEHIEHNKVNIHHISIIRNGHLIVNADFYPYQQTVVHDVASVTKSITSTLIGIAIDKGFIPNVDAPVLTFFLEVNASAVHERLRRLTIRHLLTMTSGYCRNFGEGERQLDAMRQKDNAVEFLLHEPLPAEPGAEFAYCSVGTHLLSVIITRATGRNELAFARQHLFDPLGIEDVIWPEDPQGNSNGWGDFFIHPIDLAKIGYLYLRNGVWNGKQVVSKEWIQQAVTGQVRVAEDESYGYLWWMPAEVPGLYEARGRGDQRLAVWPQKNLVVVLIGGGFDPAALGAFILSALKSEEALPANPIAYRELQAKLSAATKAPSAQSAGSLPDIATAISGKTFSFESNEIGLKSFQLDFINKDEAVLMLSLAVRISKEFGVRRSPIGLDGVYRISPSSRFNLPLAAKGSWREGNIFELMYNEFANNHLWNVTMEFKGEEATWHMSDLSGWVEATVKAHLEQTDTSYFPVKKSRTAANKFATTSPT